jgi:hypothetical protein
MLKMHLKMEIFVGAAVDCGVGKLSTVHYEFVWMYAHLKLFVNDIITVIGTVLTVRFESYYLFKI